MASKVRINLQIEDTSPLVREIIGSLKGEKGWTSTNPDEVVKVTYTVTAGEVEVINEGIYYSIPTITTAKEGDTAFSDDFRLFVYDEAGTRWRLWASADRDDVKVYHNNTLIGDGTQSSPLGLNPTTIAFKGDLNPLLKGEDNGDGTYTFTTIDGSTSFTINAGLSGNIYNTDGTLLEDRQIDLDNGSLRVSESYSSVPNHQTIEFRVAGFTTAPQLNENYFKTSGSLLNSVGIQFNHENFRLYTGQQYANALFNGEVFLKLIDNSGKVLFSKITADDIDDSTSTNKFVDQSLVNLISSALQPGDNISELNNDSDFIESSEKGQPLGVATLDPNGLLYTSQLPPISITEVIAASETTIADFAANSGNYTFQQGDVILIDDGGVVTHYLYKGGTKTDVGEYSELSASQIDWSQVVNTPTTLAGYGITDAGAAAPVQSVNGETGAVVIDADYIDDSTTVHKFVTQALINTLNSAVQPGDLATVATSGDYDDLLNKPTIPDSLDDLSGNSDDITEGTTQLFMTTTERNKLSGIDSGAEVNVNADWNAVSGDAQILNKPTLGTAAAADTGDFATAMQGALADTAVQPGDLATVATTGAYSDLTGTPAIPNSLDDLSGNSDDISEGSTNLFMTTAERSKLTGIASGAEVNVNADWNAVSGDAEILNKPTLGTAAAADTGDFATSAQGAKADTAIQPSDIDTLAELNNIITDANLDDESNPRPPTAHTHTTSEITDFDTGVSNNVDVSQNTADRHTHTNKAALDNIDNTGAGDKFLSDDGTYKGVSTGSADWGSIIGTLSNQTDLQNELDGKSDVGHQHTASDITDFDTAVSNNADVAANTNARHTHANKTDLDNYDPSNFATAAQGVKADTAVQPGDLATVATTGAYSDLSGTPTLGTASAADTGDFATAAQGSLANTALQPGSNISELNNDSGFVDSAGAASAAPVQSVNSQSGVVVLDADDIDDSATVHKFVTQALINTLNSAVQPGDLATVATTGNYSDLTGTPAIPDSLDDLSGDSDDITEGTSHLFMTTAERNKLSGIASGAEVNVNADWNAVSGDAQILNKPTLGTASAADVGDFATAVQGTKADTAIQPGDNVSDLTNDSGFVDAAGAAAAAPVQSVNGDTGAVTLDADDVGAIPASEKGANNGVATLDANGQLQTSQVPSYAITEIIEASETSIAAFAANSGSYDFDIGDVILIDNGGVISHYFYKGGTKTDVNEYSEISASQVDWGNVTNKPTLLYPGDNISELVNDEGFVDSAGAASAAPVQSVNGNTGAVTLDADDISDSSTTNKFVTQAEKNDIASAVQPGDLATVATTGAYSDLSGTPALAAVATTGAYSDLTGTPAIPEDSTDLGDTGDLVRNNADTYNSTPKVLQVITVTSAEMGDIINEVVSPIAGALYFEVE